MAVRRAFDFASKLWFLCCLSCVMAQFHPHCNCSLSTPNHGCDLPLFQSGFYGSSHLQRFKLGHAVLTKTGLSLASIEMILRKSQKRRYLGTRIPYHSSANSCETFQLIKDGNITLILLLSGDIHANPGPVKNPCSVCQKAVASNH